MSTLIYDDTRQPSTIVPALFINNSSARPNYDVILFGLKGTDSEDAALSSTMPKAPLILRRHRPLVTPRIQFTPLHNQHTHAPPVITARIDFTGIIDRNSAAHRHESLGDVNIPDLSAEPRNRVSSRRPSSRPRRLNQRSAHDTPDQDTAPADNVNVPNDREAEDEAEDNDDDDGSGAENERKSSDPPQVLIAKPHGQAGRPGDGGYTLEKKLDTWTRSLYDKVKVG